jgi:hypothetical protein
VNSNDPTVRRHLVTLANGQEFSRPWLVANVPLMFRAWQQARTPEEQDEIAGRICAAAVALETHPNRHEKKSRVVTVIWSETIRHRDVFFLPVDASDEEIRAAIALCPDAPRRTEARRDADIRVLSVDLGDDLAGAEPTPTSEARWGPLVYGIDPRLVHGPDWPPLAAAITHVAARGVDIAAELPKLTADPPLPDSHPAIELHWRLLYAYPATRPVTGLEDVPMQPGDDRPTPPEGRTAPGSPTQGVPR